MHYEERSKVARMSTLFSKGKFLLVGLISSFHKKMLQQGYYLLVTTSKFIHLKFQGYLHKVS